MSVSDPSSGIPSASASGAGALTHERDPKSRTITSSHKAPKAGRSLKLSTILRLSLVLALGLALGVLDLGGLGGVPVKCVRAQYFSQGWQPGQGIPQPPARPAGEGAGGWTPGQKAETEAQHVWESSVKGTERDGEGEGEGKDGQPQEQEQGQDTKREEGLLDGALRFGYTRILGYTDSQIDAHLAARRAASNPSFHASVSHLSHQPEVGESVEDRLGFGQASGLGRFGGLGGFGSEFFGDGAPWAILVSASGEDPTSRQLDQVFNSTLNALFPPSPSDTPPHSPSIGEAAISAAAALSSAAAGAEYEGVRKENAREEDVRRDSGQSPFDEDEESTQSGDGEVGQGEAGTEPVRVPPKAREALANWKWGYVNFAKETKLVWRWWIWKCPSIVIATPSTSPNRPYDLRFWPVAFVKPTAEQVMTFLADERHWRRLPIWEGTWGPGGSNEQYTTYLSEFFHWFYSWTERVPPWLLTILVGAGSTQLIRLLHSADAPARPHASSASTSSTSSNSLTSAGRSVGNDGKGKDDGKTALSKTEAAAATRRIAKKANAANAAGNGKSTSR